MGKSHLSGSAVGSNRRHLRELRVQIESSSQRTMLDLEEVKLVDRATVQFLGCCESKGLDLLNCPLYVREWILREKHRSSVEPRV